MADLTTYNFYCEGYFGEKVAEAAFPKYLDRASTDLNYLTYGNIDTAALNEYSEQIQKATCVLIDFLYDLEQMADTSGALNGNIESRTSGNETIKYKSIDTVLKKALANTSSKYKAELDLIKPYLTGTGLFYAGFRG